MLKHPKKILRIHPAVKDALSKHPLPISGIPELTARDSCDLLLLSDYSGDAGHMHYRTFAYYLIDKDIVPTLAQSLHEVKQRHGIAERHLSYKGRKDQLKRKALHEWMRVIRAHPGLLLIIAFSKKYDDDPVINTAMRVDPKKFIEDTGVSPNLALRIARSVCFMPLLAPYLTEHHNLFWISDSDEIADSQIHYNTTKYALQRMTQSELPGLMGKIGLFTPEDIREPELVEELLSVPDLLAGSLAAALQPPDDDLELSYPDDTAKEIVREFADFGDLHIEGDRIQSPCKRAIYTFERAEYQGRVYPHLSLGQLTRNLPGRKTFMG